MKILVKLWILICALIAAERQQQATETDELRQFHPRMDERRPTVGHSKGGGYKKYFFQYR